MKRSMKEAVALEYGQQDAPTVLAKGLENEAMDIIAAAKAQGIFVAEDPQLVAALSQVGLSEEIPEELYHAVAVMLSWAFWLKGLAPEESESPQGADESAGESAGESRSSDPL